MKVTAALSSLPPLMELLGGIGMAAALWYGSREIAAAQLTTGRVRRRSSATLFLMYGPAKKLSRVNANLQQAMAASERIFEMLDTHTEVTELPGAPAACAVRTVRSNSTTSPSATTMRRADPARRVVHGRAPARWSRSSAAAAPARRRSSTCCRVSTTSSAGSILIDGVDIRDVTLASLRRQIGIVTQETVLFDDTVANNIAYGAPNVGDAAEIEAAARAANAHEFIAAAADGLRHHDRRARPAPVGRPAAAAGHRPGAAEECADSGARRSDLGARRRIGAAGAGCAHAI